MDLIDYLANFNGEFNASLGETGGYITFSNSGRRGNVKCFQISLDSLKKTIEDILNNLHVFENIQDYVEKNWRDNGSVYFTDEVANAMITVQTKPLFSTLSKLIKWGNEPILNSVDDTQKIIISQEALKNTLAKLADTILQYSPQKTKRSVPFNPPLQTIFYGAPGTGKSHKIDGETKDDNSIRTTFHPDTDYATFVGAYKPMMEETEVRVVPVVLNNGASFDQNNGTYKEKRIVYKYEPQAFLKAYVEAWKKWLGDDEDKKYYLVIEEINRGNCAQIFGDLFQLLDRENDGYSSYAISPESAITKYLAEDAQSADGAKFSDFKFSDVTKVRDGVEKIIATADDLKEGKRLVLPPNLHIWATMNTSDQSLFPIDSAFKRRWDWEYMPIDTRKESWGIKVNGTEYSWSSFLEKINEEIGSITNSEDKKLGFYFCKAENGVISAERFVSKVLFYIYNDVFKDYGFEREFFKHKDGDGKGQVITFHSFFEANGNVNEEIVAELLENLDVDFLRDNENDIDEDADDQEHKKTLLSVSVAGERFTADGSTQFDLYLNVIKKLGVAKVGPVIEAMKYRRKDSPMATKTQVQSLIDSRGFSYVEVEGYYFVKGAMSYTLIRILEDLKRELNIDMEIEYR